MPLPLLYLVSLISVSVTFLCWLRLKDSFIEEECQQRVYRHLRLIRVIHHLNHLGYGLVLGEYIVYREQALWITLLSCLPLATLFILFSNFLNRKIKLVKGRLSIPPIPSSTTTCVREEGEEKTKEEKNKEAQAWIRSELSELEKMVNH